MLEADVMAEGNEIDLVKYGVLWQKVQEMDKKVDKLERNIEELLALANKSKGGLWMGMALASFFGGIVSWVLAHFGK
jgi:hypothetical protein